MVLRGIRVFGDTCLQLKATGCADSRSRCKTPRTLNPIGLMGVASGGLAERAGVAHRSKSGQMEAGASWTERFGLVVFTSGCPGVAS